MDVDPLNSGAMAVRSAVYVAGPPNGVTKRMISISFEPASLATVLTGYTGWVAGCEAAPATALLRGSERAGLVVAALGRVAPGDVVAGCVAAALPRSRAVIVTEP